MRFFNGEFEMSKSAGKDPTEPIRQMAADFPNVEQGTACTQSSFKSNGKSFLFIGIAGRAAQNDAQVG